MPPSPEEPTDFDLIGLEMSDSTFHHSNSMDFGWDDQTESLFMGMNPLSPLQTIIEKPPDSLDNFLNSVDDPWRPVTTFVPASSNSIPKGYNNHVAPYSFDPRNPAFSTYRSVKAPSDCETIPVDSGYASSYGRRPRSIQSASLYGDDHSLDASLYESLVTATNLGAQYETQTEQPFLSASECLKKIICPDCDKVVKTQSELKKHKHRHDKPYRCTFAGCERGLDNRGFSTPNDLMRHRGSVHQEYHRLGGYYVCSRCTKEKSKRWPRPDNFRSHLSRVHGIKLQPGDDLKQHWFSIDSAPNDNHKTFSLPTAAGDINAEVTGTSTFQGATDCTSNQYQAQSKDLKCPSGYEEQLFDQGVLQNGRAVAPAQENDQMLSQPGSTTFAQNPPSVFMKSDQSVVPPTRPLDPENAASAITGLVSYNGSLLEPKNNQYSSPQFLPLLLIPEDVDDLSVIGNFSNKQANPVPSIDDAGLNARAADSGEAKNDIQDRLKAILKESGPESSDMIALLKEVPKSLLETALYGDVGDGKLLVGNPLYEQTDRQYRCSDCSKTFHRACELTKHSKRHARPYGCTHYQCSKLFGSKGDWKRHECGQHYPLETWCCEEADCEKICHRQEGFRNHLSQEHQISDSKIVEEKLDKCRTGRHCEGFFYCGFCVEFVENKDARVNSWTRRFDHIDNHLFGRAGLSEKRIDQWIYLEDIQAKELSLATDTKASKATTAKAAAKAKTHQSSESTRKRKSGDGSSVGSRKRIEQ